ncbi:MAG: D-alanyl-D-alanine carboxypeptidase/D-alanyl-D-alanine-endopeptidase [Vulcanimicrobiaceae bacterium]
MPRGYATGVSPVPTPVPPPRWTPAQRRDVRARLSDVFAGDIAARMGIAVLAADGSTLFARHATRALAPASTLKLVIAATALDTLGPQHRFVTRFVSVAPPQLDGTLPGGLWLVGGGDPMLDSKNVREGVGVLARSGIKRIDGFLQIDDTSFSGPEQNPRWDPDDLDYDYAAGTSAIALDGGVVEFDVTPGVPGSGAHVRPVPENESITFDGTIRTGSYGSSTYVTIARKAQAPALVPPDPSGRDVAIPRNEYTIDGHIAPGETQKYYKPVLGMPGYAGGVVAAMLAERGIALPAGYRSGAAPPSATVLWAHRSPPLGVIMRDMLVTSNNHTAETLLRIVGENASRPGTDEAGVAFEKRELARLGVRHDRMRVYDGSGLSPGDRIMPLTLAQLLAAQTRGPYADAYVRALPRVGIEGTVKYHRLHAALGRTRAKSGHIENVNGLAGVVVTRRHGRVAFAFLVNDRRANADIVTEEEDRALDVLATL